jgi:2,5-diketo-D-gluconate reductase A
MPALRTGEEVAPRVALSGDSLMPALGLGTWPLVGEEARAAVATALNVGYRLIDTAEQYGNEVAVGRAIRDSGVPREEIFMATKFNARWHSEELVVEAYASALDRLETDYADLLLIHWPNPWLDRYVQAWKGMIRLRAEGRLRAIGTSNFTEGHLRRLIEETGVAPEVNQVELDPTLPRKELRAFHAVHGIVTESWGALGRGGALLSDPVVTAIARRHRKSPAQIVLRWHLQQGVVPVPRSSDPRRIAENLDAFDFELSHDDLERLDRLDQGRGPVRDPEEHGH